MSVPIFKPIPSGVLSPDKIARLKEINGEANTLLFEYEEASIKLKADSLDSAALARMRDLHQKLGELSNEWRFLTELFLK